MKLRVLVVDDSRLAKSMIARAVQSVGAEVVGFAANGIEAIEMFKKLKPDLVTMDIKMPDMDGIAALRHILSIDRKAKVVMVSSLGEKEAVLESVKIGAKNFILKPFTQETVRDILERTLPEFFEEDR